jgi:hypothetical protein
LCINDLYFDECRRGQFLLPSTQNAPGNPIAARDLGEARIWLRGLFEDPAFVRFAESPPVAVTGRRNYGTFRPRGGIGHVT